MKILGIVCSPRRGGNTEVLVNEALSGARDTGAEVELVTLYNKNIAPCDGCESCAATGICKIKDDMQDIYPKLLEADGIIFGTPVYFWNVSAQAKVLIDRTYVLRTGRKLRNKIGGVVAVARRVGVGHVFSAFYDFFGLQRMIPATGATPLTSGEEISPEERGAGAVAYADKRGEVRQDQRAMAEARALGKNMARTVQRFKQGGII